MMNLPIKIDEQESLNFHSNSENFYLIISKLQGLHIYLNNYPSSKCKDDYLTTMAHLLEDYLDSQKQLYLRHYLRKIIVTQIKDNGAVKYFKKRFAKIKIRELLQYHYNLTGKRLLLTNINYEHQKFKLKVV